MSDFIDANFPREVDFLKSLVRVPSDNPPGDCARHAEESARLLEGLGFTVERHRVPDDIAKQHGMVSATNLIVRERFGSEVQAAMAGERDAWAATPTGRLALVLLLDQLPRNLFRRQAAAFAGDARAQAQVQTALAAGEDEALPTIGRVFLYLPLTHAESLPLQDECVRRFERLRATAAPERHADLDNNLRYARLHRDIVARFGRFPHRNAALGRASTAEELEFLKDGPRFGQ